MQFWSAYMLFGDGSRYSTCVADKDKRCDLEAGGDG